MASFKRSSRATRGPWAARATRPASATNDVLASAPSRLEWAVAVLVVIVQQGAFVSVPLLLSNMSIGATSSTADPNPFNTWAVASCGATVALLCALQPARVLTTLRENWAHILIAGFIVLSVIWSIHSDLTFRRGINYVLGVLMAAYLASRFSFDQLMRAASYGIALAAIGSYAFVAVYPQYGILHETFLDGAWRGVYANKNHMGVAMSVGVFVQCYLLVRAKRWNWPDFALLIAVLGLSVLSLSAMAVFCSAFFVTCAGVYKVWTLDRPIGIITIFAIAYLGALAFVLFWADPGWSLALIGKDPSITGRTDIWPLVVPLVAQRPILGWGYGATWQITDSPTMMIAGLLNWAPPHAHNEALELAYQLGIVGVALVALAWTIGAWRGFRCVVGGGLHLGFFLLLFVAGMTIYGVTEVILVQGQSIAWLVFSLLSFNAGHKIALGKAVQFARRARQAATRTPPSGDGRLS